jgi:hypothetical protein
MYFRQLWCTDIAEENLSPGARLDSPHPGGQPSPPQPVAHPHQGLNTERRCPGKVNECSCHEFGAMVGTGLELFLLGEPTEEATGRKVGEGI